LKLNPELFFGYSNFGGAAVTYWRGRGTHVNCQLLF